MPETRWEITDPQNRIRRLPPVETGVVTVQIVLPSDDPATVAAVEQAAADAGVVMTRVSSPAPAEPGPVGLPPVNEVRINGVLYLPAQQR